MPIAKPEWDQQSSLTHYQYTYEALRSVFRIALFIRSRAMGNTR
jgi:hypothetical protein